MNRPTDRQLMIDFISNYLPDGTSGELILASGPSGQDITADVTVCGDSLEIRTNCPEWVTVREIYDHIRWKLMPTWEQAAWLRTLIRPTRPEPRIGGWCNPASAVPPPEFPFGPLQGSQKNLSWWLFGDQIDDHRRLHGKAARKSVWVRELHSRLYEVWFKTQKEFEVAIQRRDEKRRSDTGTQEGA